MSIQSVSNTASNPYVRNLANDFQTFQKDVQAFESSQSSGNSDQVTLSQDALTKAITQVQNDIASLSQQTQGTQGHHHHHHHGMDATISSGSTTNSSTTPDGTTPSSTTLDLSAFLSNKYGSQSQSNVSAINITA